MSSEQQNIFNAKTENMNYFTAKFPDVWYITVSVTPSYTIISVYTMHINDLYHH